MQNSNFGGPTGSDAPFAPGAQGGQPGQSGQAQQPGQPGQDGHGGHGAYPYGTPPPPGWFAPGDNYRTRKTPQENVPPTPRPSQGEPDDGGVTPPTGELRGFTLPEREKYNGSTPPVTETNRDVSTPESSSDEHPGTDDNTKGTSSNDNA